MTAVVASFGFYGPFDFDQCSQRPLASVEIGGLFSSSPCFFCYRCSTDGFIKERKPERTSPDLVS